MISAPRYASNDGVIDDLRPALGASLLDAVDLVGEVTLMKMPHDAQIFAFWSMMLFLGVLTVGFIYEWNKGALEWE